MLVLKRHKQDFGQRLATNIKHARSPVSRENIDEYFNNLQETMYDMRASDIFNYDESNALAKNGAFIEGGQVPKSANTIMVLWGF